MTTGPTDSGPLTTFAVVVPLKSTASGKSRLRLPADDRAALAVAMARDTLAAVHGAGQVGRLLLVVQDARDAERIHHDSAQSLHWPAPGLNRAIAAGARALTAAGWSGPVAVLPADLPFLTGDEIDAALLATAGQARVVADGAGTGTTLLTAPGAAALRPRYGPDSFDRHQRAGAVALLVERASGLRRDVDVLHDLARGATSGRLGGHTRAVLDRPSGTGSAQVTVLP